MTRGPMQPSEHFCPLKNGSDKDVRELARAVAKARKSGVPVKVLMALTGLGRTRLHQLRKMGESL